jgi:outer membrane protein
MAQFLSFLNIMKKLFFLLMFSFMVCTSRAQSLRYGYFSLDSVFTAMPEYAVAQKNLADLRAKYDEEMKRAEDEFNAKYEEFLETQRDLIPSILSKRQTELQEIMEKNVAFKKEAVRLLDEARKDAYAPLRERIFEAVRRIGRERGYAFVLNTDGDACPYLDATCGENIAPLLRTALNIH